MSSLTPRSPGQRGKREAVEAAILAAAEGLLADGATYAELNVERIARRAGISRPAFYFYFRDKRELLLRLTADVADVLYHEAERWWTAAPESQGGPDGLRHAVATIVALYREHGPLLRAVVQTAAYDEAVAAFWRALIERFVTATRERIEVEQAAGRVDSTLPPQATAFALTWMTERTCHQHLQQPALTEPDLLAALQETWVRAIYGRL